MKKYIFFFLFGFTLNALLAQKDSTITVHEWGTFTTLCGSDGKTLSGLHIDEEKLPSFVYNLNMQATADSNAKGVFTKTCTPHNVIVKMETPVIYLYADKPSDFKIRVDFNGGLISQWYPQRSGGTANINDCVGGMDFSTGYNDGFIEWKGTLQKPGIPEKYTNAALNSPVWMSPRATQSNLIKNQDSLAEQEKYLFYRGIGNFEVPFKIEFDKDGLFRITNNNSTDAITYAMVYHKPMKGPAEIWWAGGMNRGVMVKMWPRKVDGLTADKVIINFKKALSASGLYKDEAEAMLKTWEHSYFETPGLKVFWIAPRNFTDRILPLQMTPLPKSVERVFVGRSEVLPPDFEEFIFQVYQNASDDVFFGDRYAEAYRERYYQLREKGRLDDKNEEKYYVYPNATGKKIHILAKPAVEEGTKVKVEIYNLANALVNSTETVVNKKGWLYYAYNYNNQPIGEYTIKISAGEKTHSEKVVINN